MKYIILVGDGMADHPCDALHGKTPLEVAHTPHMDGLASKGIIGRVRLTPPGYPPGSDVTQLTLLGYDPVKYYTGRSPLEAASMGVDLDEDDVAYRCNLVTLTRNGKYITDKLYGDALMDDYSGGHVGTEEARLLIMALDKEIGGDDFRFYPGVSYRHLFIWHEGEVDVKCTPPHDITGRAIGEYLPRGKGKDKLLEIMNLAIPVLASHPVNKARTERGEKMANSIWLWGQGKRPSMETFYERYGLRGSMIAAVDLTRGIGKYAGFDIIDVPGATGYIDTNYEGKGEYALKELSTKDIVYVHVEAPDEAGHNGDLHGKIKAIEEIDKKIVGPIKEYMKDKIPFRMLILCDHLTPLDLRTHSPEPVPFILYDSTKEGNRDVAYTEKDAQKSSILIEDGTRLIEALVKPSTLEI